MESMSQPRVDLTKFAWLSIAAALATIALKTAAWWVTGSVGLLSDAAESVVNLIAAVVALFALRVAARPADKNHHFGHSKAEYFSSAIEGVMIFVAAAAIVGFAIERLIVPRPLEEIGIGLVISVVAALVNGAVAWVLLRAGRRYNSITLRADAHHLFTDLVTSAGVVVGVVLVGVTGWNWLDPVVALLVGINILWTGWRFVSESASGLMDESLPKEDNARLRQILTDHESDEVHFHAFRTRISGARAFMEFHMLVPGAWSVQRGHDAMEDLIDLIRSEYTELRVIGHLEPIEDPRSYEDIHID
ncbi:transporter [Tessaracoccus lapidicaptus]|uniref:Transporter n=1 Tax=Tessaracoccus lapidicaptus TaxID=1427523 RepID=A0A1C0AHD9_9ACTN|nr:MULTISPECIES: cation diffusion facilitator family transporter [Tessaracoccus]AQX16493.1 cation-efflux pump [Tessaracoccus sp. T2.5-30]OCL31408.1 transporter [Tessaracoccus lapidicaptus]VEP41152.1 Ferrous-iron efflux pump FieF [Tessaracoccus lapidicaptus]